MDSERGQERHREGAHLALAGEDRPGHRHRRDAVDVRGRGYGLQRVIGTGNFYHFPISGTIYNKMPDGSLRRIRSVP